MLRYLFVLSLVSCVQEEDSSGNAVFFESNPLAVDLAPPPGALELHLPLLVAGEVTSVAVTGALVNERVGVLGGQGGQGAGVCLPQLGGQCLGLDAPFAVLGLAQVNALGNALIDVLVWDKPGEELCLQAVVRRGVAGVDSVLSDVECQVLLDGSSVAYTIGGTSASWTMSNYFRGNVYQNVNGGILDSYSVYLGLASACDLDWYVHSGPSPSGPWQVAYSGTNTAAPTTGHMKSPPVGLQMVPGTYYGVGVAWNCSATYYGEYSAWSGYDAGVGEFENNYWDNAYGGYSPLFTPSSTGTDGLAYEHNYAIFP